MKTNHVLLLTLTLGVSTCLLTAQDGNPPRPEGQPPRPGQGGPGGERGSPGGQRGQGGPGGPGGQRQMMPIIEALDINKDGVIDADEIAKASASLKKLDKNGDGKLTQDEYRGQRPGGQGGPGGPGGPGGEGRPGGSGEGNRPQRPKAE